MSRKHQGGDPTADEHRVVVRDRRRIDPETGQVRPPDAGEEPASGVPAAGTADQASAESAATGRHAAPESFAQEMVEPEIAEPETAEPGVVEPDLAELDMVEPDVVEPDVIAEKVAGLSAQLDERTADLQRLQAEYANYRKRVERDREAVVTAAKSSLAIDLLPVLDDLERAEAHGDLTGALKAVADKLVASLNRAGLQPFGHEGEPFEPSVHEAVQHATSPDVTGPTVTAVLRRGYRFGERVVRPALVAVTDYEPAAQAEDAPAEQSPGI